MVEGGGPIAGRLGLGGPYGRAVVRGRGYRGADGMGSLGEGEGQGKGLGWGEWGGVWVERRGRVVVGRRGFPLADGMEPLGKGEG